MQVLMLLCTNNPHYRQLTVNDLTEQENGKFDSVITCTLDIPMSSLMMFVILHFFLFTGWFFFSAKHTAFKQKEQRLVGSE
jgi:hypothetical protein